MGSTGESAASICKQQGLISGSTSTELAPGSMGVGLKPTCVDIGVSL